jgi:glutamate dehydrogenase
VVGEGGNLGLTQLGRIEYSLAGGHCNTDFIDNAGGVDSSDQEVNIKILLNAALQSGKLTMNARNKLLKSMTTDVANKVLRNSYLQSQAISNMAIGAGDRIGEQAELLRILERDAGLDRKLEYLPDEKAIELRRSSGQGLTRPEISILLSYSKIDLYNELLESDVPEDRYLSSEIKAYFPSKLGETYEQEITQHRLRREIISTRITNSLVNRMGAAFAHRMHEELGLKLSDIARAYTVARDAFNVRPLWDAIEALDNKIPAAMQLDMMLDTQRLIKHVTLWLVQNNETICDIEQTVSMLANDVLMLEETMAKLLNNDELKQQQRRLKAYLSAGVPEQEAKRISNLRMLYPLPDVNWLANSTGVSSDKIAIIYFRLANSIDLVWVRRQIEQLKPESRWQALARNALRDDLYLRQRNLSAKVLAAINPKTKIEKQVDDWLETNKHHTQTLKNLVAELKTNDGADYLSLSVVLRQLGKLAQ